MLNLASNRDALAKKETLQLSDIQGAKKNVLYALISDHSELKVCMELNRLFHLQLTLDEPAVSTSRDVNRSFRRYTYEHEDVIEKYTLLVNRQDGQVLFSALKQIDYLLILIAEKIPSGLENGLRTLRDQKIFNAVNPIDISRVKGLQKYLEY